MTTSPTWLNIQAADGAFGAWLALPHGGSGPGIVLLQEIFGVNQHIREVAAQYAADGYVVLAPDLFWRSGARTELGYAAADWQRAMALKQATDVAAARADIAAAAAALRAMPAVTGGVAALGYCFGGLLAYHALADATVDAASAYYGGGIEHQLERAGAVGGPLQLHFGASDAHIPAAAVSSIAACFGARDEVEIHVYADAGHGFNCPYRDTYLQRASAQAHGNTLIFLSETL